MRTLFMTILMVAICLTGYRFFIADNTTGVWGNAKTVKDLKEVEVSATTIPSS